MVGCHVLEGMLGLMHESTLPSNAQAGLPAQDWCPEAWPPFGPFAVISPVIMPDSTRYII